MSELSRQRRSRDLWVSRSHLWAGAAGVLIGLLLAFLVGNVVGRRAALSREVEMHEHSEDELIELLARVEASASASGGVDRLTYPDALSGRPTEVGIPEAPALPGRVEVAAPPLATLPGVGRAPVSGVGLGVVRTADMSEARRHIDALVDVELPVWVRTLRTGGLDVYEVGVGPWPTEDDGRLAISVHRSLMPEQSRWVEFGNVPE